MISGKYNDFIGFCSNLMLEDIGCFLKKLNGVGTIWAQITFVLDVHKAGLAWFLRNC